MSLQTRERVTAICASKAPSMENRPAARLPQDPFRHRKRALWGAAALVLIVLHALALVGTISSRCCWSRDGRAWPASSRTPSRRRWTGTR